MPDRLPMTPTLQRRPPTSPHPGDRQAARRTGPRFARCRIWVVERDRRLRETLGRLIERQPDLCCDSALDCDRGLILRLSSEIAPEAVLMEPGPPAGGGLELLQALRQRCPSTLILVHSEQADRRSVMQALEAGACGYLVKPADGAQVIDALRSVLRAARRLIPARHAGCWTGWWAHPRIGAPAQRWA